jgi:hypothetical protein
MELFIRENHRIWMVTIYLLLVAGFLHLRPSIAFGREGRVRPFGTSNQDTTVFPLWWWIFILAVVAYGITLYAAGFKFASLP